MPFETVELEDFEAEEQGCQVKIIFIQCPMDYCALPLPTVWQLKEHLQDVHRIFEHRCFVPDCTYSSSDL